MLEELKNNPKLMKEYESVFSTEEQISNSLNLDSENIKISAGIVYFKDISITEPIKDSRRNSYMGLTQSVKDLGILTPIHVMISEGYDDWVTEGKDPDEYEGAKYILIDGFRRLYAGVKCNLDRCNAIIWDFKDKDYGSRMLITLSLVLNKKQAHDWREIWGLAEILQVTFSYTSNFFDYLLNLESGDYMKLKQIMESTEYPEIIDDLLSKKKTLQQCYSALQKALKEEDQAMKEDKQSIVQENDEAEDLGVDGNEERKMLSDNEVKDVLEMNKDYEGELSEDDFNELTGKDIPDFRQTPGAREGLDPGLKLECFKRDNFTCQCSGIGVDSGLPVSVAKEVLHVHHKVPVSDGGTDTLDNLITLDLTSHTLVHVIQWNNGKINMSKEQYDALDDRTKEYLKKVFKIAKIAVDADRRVGRSKEEIKKEGRESTRFQMPGVVGKQNEKVIEEGTKSKASEEEFD